MARALVHWQHAAGPYWPYVCAAPFLGDGPLRRRHGRSITASASFMEAIGPLVSRSGVAIFADLPPPATLPATTFLNQLGFVVVPVIQRWIAAPAVLPCDRLVDLLVAYRPRGPRRQVRGVVFLLDGDRQGAATLPRLHAFDNRYAYPICRFPPPDLLLRQGITETRWLPAAPIAEDLLPYAEQLAQAGLAPLQ